MIKKDRQKIKKFFRKKKISQEKQANYCSCSLNMISMWYAGKTESNPLKEKLLKLYEAVNEK